MPVPITSGYAALLTLLFVALSLRVVRQRQRLRVPIGVGSDAILERAVRVHGNFAEYVPLVLVLLLAGELTGLPHWLLHAAGIALLVGRAAHAVGVSPLRDILPLRGLGMAGTFAPLIALSLALLARVLLGVS